MEWSFIVAAVRRRIVLVIAFAIVGALPGMYKLLTAEPAYEATATVSVATPTVGAGAATAAYQPDRYVVSQLSVVTSRDTLETAAKSLPGDWSADALASLISVEQEPKADLIRISATAGDPKIAADVANAVANTYIDDATKRLVEARQPEIDALNTKLNDLETQIADVNTIIVDAMQEQIAAARSSNSNVLLNEYVVVPNEMQKRDALQSEYTRVLSARSDIELGVSNQAPNVLIEQATAPGSPKGELGKFLVIGGAIFGALAGTAIALMLAQLSSKLLDEQSVEAILGTPLVGSVPRTRTFAESPLAALESPAPETRETIERLSVRAEAMASPEIDDTLTIAVVGTQPAAGTTTLTLALARRFAKAGYQVVVVDGDLRSQTISDLCHVDQRGGISAVLRSAVRGVTKRSQFFTSTSNKNVAVLGVGDIDRRAALRRDALGPILEAAREKGQIVLYDGGAITASALTLFATKAAGVVVLALPLQDQEQQELREVANLLPEDRSRVLVVATAPTKRRTRSLSIGVRVDDEPDADGDALDDTASRRSTRRDPSDTSSEEAV
ncbi:MAG: hypothetical protein GX868_17510 [Actinobacteria bacterium]|nr:hypothetical protein [Actinomycetota bacterium]